MQVRSYLAIFWTNKDFLRKKNPSLCRLPSVKQCCPGHNFFSFQPRYFIISGYEYFGIPPFFRYFYDFFRVSLEQKYGFLKDFNSLKIPKLLEIK
jgi:hypothetical protein